jgi:hypothetical protein
VLHACSPPANVTSTVIRNNPLIARPPLDQ